MMQIIRCRNCGKQKALPFTLKWEYASKWCDKCKRYEDFIITYEFCCAKCLKEFVDRFVGHEHQWLEDEWNPLPTCEVCGVKKMHLEEK